MTQRETKLLRIFLVLAGVLAPAGLLYATVLGPYWNVQRERAELQEEVDGNEKLIAQRLKEKQQLERWRLLSLPGAPGKDGKLDTGKAELEYTKFLRPLLEDCGFYDVHTQSASQAKSAPQGKKPPPHVILQFHVTAKGDLAGLIKFFEKMDRAPYVHRVKSLSLAAKDGKGPKDLEKLTMTITIEAVIVNRSEKHVNLVGRMMAVDAVAGLQRGPIGLAMVPWAVSPVGPASPARPSAGRRYADILARNIFVGQRKQVEPPKEIVKKTEKPKEKPKSADLREEYRLVQINHTNVESPKVKANEAYLWSKNMKETEGYKQLHENNRFTYLAGKEAKVLRIGHREMYFQDTKTEKIYVIGMGEMMADVVQRPLDAKDIQRLGLPGKRESAKND
jgi:hypothetical protein